MKKIILVLFSCLFVVGLLVGCSDKNSEKTAGNATEEPVEGSWNCLHVMHEGNKLTPTGDQENDYTLEITGNTVNANIYGTEFSGSLEKIEGPVDVDDIIVYFYTMNTTQGTKYNMEYFESSDVIIFDHLGQGLDSDNNIAFKRR